MDEHSQTPPFHVKHTGTPIDEAPPSPAEPAPFSLDDTPLARELADLTARRRALEGTTVTLSGRTRILTVSNQKGGVGKTTTTVNVAAALAAIGARVLVIDLDPQGNASTALGIPHSAETPSVYDVLIDEFPLADIIQTSPESPNLLCAPSTIHLAGAEIELVSQVAREHRLKTALDDHLAGLEEPLDFVLIDCPPSLGLLTINAFTAADEVFIPIQCEYYALEGLSQLLGSVRMIQKHLNPSLHVSTILLTMYDGRTNLAQQVAHEVRTHFPQEIMTTVIPRSVRVSEAPSFGQTVIAYDGQSAGAIAYREAAVEIVKRGETGTQIEEGER
jgi:chromosome partitioning protein